MAVSGFGRIGNDGVGLAGGILHRGPERAELAAALAELRSGRPAVVVVEGERGFGRSALLSALVAGCGGSVVLRARCHGGETGFGWGVVGQLLERLPTGAGLLAGSVGAGPEDGCVSGVFDRLYRVVREAAAGGPVVLAVDDVQWADPVSARWCSYVARRLDDVPVAIAVTVRPGDVARGCAGAELVADLLGLGHARVVRAGPLCAPCTGELLRRRLGVDVDPEFAAACHGLARGNPRVLDAAAARLAAAGLVTGVEPGAVTWVRAEAVEVVARAAAVVVHGWLRQDDPATAAVAEHLAICAGAGAAAGYPAATSTAGHLTSTTAVDQATTVASGHLPDTGGLELAAMLAGIGEDAARVAREVLHRAGLLAPGGPDRFGHPAMAATITAQLTPQARAAMHNHAAAVLAQLGGPATLAAEHVMSAGTTGAPWASSLLRQAAAHTAAAGRWARATRYLNRALLEPGSAQQTLAITAELAASEYHHDLPACLRHATIAAHLGTAPAAVAGARTAAAGRAGATGAEGLVAGGAGDVMAGRAGAAALTVLADAGMAAEDGDIAAMLAAAATALAGPGQAGLARAGTAMASPRLADQIALRQLAAPVLLWGHALLPEHGPAVRQAVRAIASSGLTRHPDAGRAAGPVGVAGRQLLAVLALARVARGRGRRQAVALAMRAAAPGPARLTDPLVSTLVCAGLALVWAGELEAATDAVTQAVAAAQRTASVTGQALALLARCEVGCQAGDLPAAHRDAGAAVQLFATTGAVALAATASATAARVQLMRGEHPAGPVPIPGGAGHPYLIAQQHEAQGMAAAARADRALALRHYLEAGRHLMTAGIVSPANSAWRSRAVTVLAGLGRAWEARTLAASEIALARAWGAPGPLGRALTAAATAHDGAARRDLLTEAVAVLDGTGYRLHLARALIRLGAHTHVEQPTRAARDLLDRGHDLAQACGAATLAAIALRAMNAAGARPRADRAPEALTAAERRVAELVVTGLSSQAVAASLTLSKRTVDTHLGRIYRKLGITGRADLHQAITGTAAGRAVPLTRPAATQPVR